MKHLERCSNSILKSQPEDKWGAMVKVSINKVLSRRKMCLGQYSKIGG
jgi:hypothetical protein